MTCPAGARRAEVEICKEGRGLAVSKLLRLRMQSALSRSAKQVMYLQVYPSSHTYKVGSRTDPPSCLRATAVLLSHHAWFEMVCCRSGGGSSTPVGGVGSSGTGTPLLGSNVSCTGATLTCSLPRVAGIGTPIGGIGAPFGPVSFSKLVPLQVFVHFCIQVLPLPALVLRTESPRRGPTSTTSASVI